MRRLLALLLLMLPLSALAEDIVLQNEHVKMVFDGGSEFRIKSFVMEGVELAPEQTTHPWEVELLGPRGENPLIKPWMAEYGGGYVRFDTAHFSWRIILDGRDDNMVLMTVTLAPGMELPEFRCDAILKNGWIVTTAEFPRIAVRRPEDAKVIMPVGYGIRYAAPAGGWISANYPSHDGGMQMAMVGSPEGTLFFSTRDEDASQKQLFIGFEGGSCIFLQKTIAAYDWTDELGIFQIPWAAVMGFTREGWEQTALKWYRPWALDTKWGRRSLAERPIAPWMRKADVWLRPIGVTPELMEAVRKGIAYYGKDLGLHWYRWHQIPYDTNYPDYFPEKDGFAEMISEAQSLGAHVTPYINGRLWDAANHTYKELDGAKASCRRRDGTLYTEIYDSKVVNSVTCPSSPIWQKVQEDLCRRILDSLGTDGIYIDQIGAAKGEACYAEGHSHSPGGGAWWHLAYRDLLQHIHRDVCKPGKAVTTEENAECYIDLFDMMLVVNAPHGPGIEMVPLFPLIYSDRCIYSGYTYMPSVINDGSFDFMTMKGLLWGAQLGWINPLTIMSEENAAQAEFLRTLGRFRSGNHDIFDGGRFYGEFAPGGDNPSADIPGYQTTPLVMGAIWSNQKGRRAYVLVNMDNAAHKVSLPNGKYTTVPARQAVKIWK